MKNSKGLDLVLVVSAAVLPFTAVLYGCSSSKSRSRGGTSGFVQVERLGRPAVNEGLVVTNAFLNAYNSIAPNQDIAVLTAPANAAFLAEVDANLTAVDGLDGDNTDVNNPDVIQAFIPDVMRIDTKLNITSTTDGYTAGAFAVGTVVRPVGGRKLEDDVVDTTLTLLVSGNSLTPAVGDNVDYRDAAVPVADGAGQVDHDLLFGQTVPRGPATFPFLPAPN